MGAARIEAVATAAVRKAIDGNSFIKKIKRRFRIPVKILSGTEEARLSAFGLLASVPAADGLFGYLGGGGLELASLSMGRIINSASPLLLAHALSGGVPGLLGRTRLKIAESKLILELPRVRAPYMDETVERRLKALARALELKPKLR